jgi:ubiquinone/menaquinone biosynthesis C-methylase UbiE
MKRVCKPNGSILLLEHGMPTLLEAHQWYHFKSGKELKSGGYFCDRHWDELLKQYGSDL